MARPRPQPRLSAVVADLVRWYVRARRDLPWRRTRDPYAVWISETMLQQTRVETVVPYYERFLSELPDVRCLAEAPLERVLALWSGLGYYRRARMLHVAAARVLAEHGGSVPTEASELQGLPGIGAYTAGAIASIAFGRAEALVDGNVARVLSRLFAIESDPKSTAGRQRIWALARQLVAEVDGDPGDWNQALMELGATVCVAGEPRCGVCPVAARCDARARGIAAELPRSAPRAAARSVRAVAIVLASSTEVLLAHRRPEGLFGGLWEPPMASGREPASLARVLHVDAGVLARAGQVEHVLSHRRMRVEVVRGPIGRRRRWRVPEGYDAIEVVRVADLSLRAHSTLARKVLVAAGVLALAKAARRGLRSSG
jgi:A/G-specific adenine glycosylase